MADNTSDTPATEGNQTLTGSSTNEPDTNLIANGSFQDSPFSGSAHGAPADWTLGGTANTGGLHQSASRASDGDQYVAMGGWANGGGLELSQAVSLTAGNSYKLSYDVDMWQNFSGAEEVIRVEIVDNTGTVVQTDTVSLRDFESQKSPEVTFDAPSNDVTVRFVHVSSAGTNDLDFDNVRLVATNNDTLSGGFGDDTITTDAGDDIIAGDGAVPGAWQYTAYDYDFSSAHGQAFDIENGTVAGSGYVTDFDEDNLINSVRGTTGAVGDFGIIYTSTLDVVQGGTYRFNTVSDDGTTIQIFDSAGNPVTFTNQLGGDLPYHNNDRHQAPTDRWGDADLDPNETYTIQVRYWENQGQDVLQVRVQGPDTGDVSLPINQSGMLGLPPGPEYSTTGTPAGVEGDDILDGGAGDDIIDGNGGDDTITGGLDDDTLTGGDGFDTFVYNAGDGDDTITDFNTGTGQSIGDGDQSNNDFLDLSAFYSDKHELRADFDDDGILNQSVGDFTDNTALGGTITLEGVSSADLGYDNTNVACFAAGTRIKTSQGIKRIETLRPGMQIKTLDHGWQKLRWIGAREVDGRGVFAPICIAKGALGNSRDVIVSPQHRVLVSGWRAELLFGEEELLVPAKLLVNHDTIYRLTVPRITYVHLLFESHEVIETDGLLSESFHPGPQGLAGLTEDARTELLSLFPELSTNPGRLARMAPKAQAAKSLFSEIRA